MRRRRVGVLFGGVSSEHEISLLSARSVMQVMDREMYLIVPIGITKEGEWLTQGDPMNTLVGKAEEDRKAVKTRIEALTTAHTLPNPFPQVDVVFPLLHGPFGEDGTVQGLLEMAGIPYVGAGVLASALGMDKAFMKRVFREQGLPVAKFAVIRRQEWETKREAALETSGIPDLPLFVKPANGGSSMGITKVRRAKELPGALEEAFRYDLKVVLEEAIEGREIECSVLGNDEPQVSLPGEIVYSREFYDYEAKYLDSRTRLVAPVALDPALVSHLQVLSAAAFRSIDCSGMARVDFFLRHSDQKVFVNEINTIPGFTPVSMFPRLWEATGIGFSELVDRLIQLGLERYASKTGFKGL